MAKKGTERAARTPLSRERVLRAAIEIADQSGLEALTMRRLGQELGVEAMSLYRHVENRDGVLDGIIEIVLSEIEVPAPGTEWKRAMRRRAISAHEVLLRHPWASALLESHTGVSPARLRYADSILGSLRAGGFGVELAYRAFLTLDSYIYGFTLQEVNWPHDADALPEVTERLRPQISADEYPNVLEAMSHVAESRSRARADSKRGDSKRKKSSVSAARSASSAYSADFDAGLDLILDGLEHLVRKRR